MIVTNVMMIEVIVLAVCSGGVRGVYTIESLEQMLQKNFRGEDLTSNQGGMYSKKILAD